MSTEVAGPVTTHPQLLPEGGHSYVGGRGDSGSADSLQVGVALDTPVDLQTRLIVMWQVLPMF